MFMLAFKWGSLIKGSLPEILLYVTWLMWCTYIYFVRSPKSI